jgi:hypothetical protein
MSGAEATGGVDVVRALVDSVTQRWAQDPESDVVWAGDYEGRRGIRMRQAVREATTVWFDVGERTLGVEAYVLSIPPRAGASAYRLPLVHNAGVRRIHFALDRRGDLLLVGRVPLQEVTEHELELALGEVYALVERALPSLVRAVATAPIEREKSS